MQDLSGSAASDAEIAEHPVAPSPSRRNGVVSTHVLVPETQAEKLRELSRKTRVAQSEYLREAVDDLLCKYDKLPRGEK
ncbi:MAG: ribbon-helix-helix domain-containing protein [Myxococcaceae bacterium]|nr:ribbon-helix-helix domain-containing protein [Myxococcaceae bacterium]